MVFTLVLMTKFTLLGGKLDIEFDGLTMLIVTLVAIWYGQLAWWFVSVALSLLCFYLGHVVAETTG